MLTQFLGQIMFYCFIESAQVLCFMTGFWNTQNPALAVCFHVLVSILEFVHLLKLETKVREVFLYSAQRKPLLWHSALRVRNKQELYNLKLCI